MFAFTAITEFLVIFKFNRFVFLKCLEHLFWASASLHSIDFDCIHAARHLCIVQWDCNWTKAFAVEMCSLSLAFNLHYSFTCVCFFIPILYTFNGCLYPKQYTFSGTHKCMEMLDEQHSRGDVNKGWLTTGALLQRETELMCCVLVLKLKNVEGDCWDWVSLPAYYITATQCGVEWFSIHPSCDSVRSGWSFATHIAYLHCTDKLLWATLDQYILKEWSIMVHCSSQPLYENTFFKACHVQHD